MRLFHLHREKDPSGVSGIGIVAYGVQFPSGKCAVEWIKFQNSINIFDSVEEILRVHGHEETTKLVWKSINNDRDIKP